MKVRRWSQLEISLFGNRDLELYLKYNETINKVEHFLLLRFKNTSTDKMLKTF